MYVISISCKGFKLSWIDKQDDVFKLVKAKDAEIWETYILTGCYPILKRANLLLQAVRVLRKLLIVKTLDTSSCTAHATQLVSSRPWNGHSNMD